MLCDLRSAGRDNLGKCLRQEGAWHSPRMQGIPLNILSGVKSSSPSEETVKRISRAKNKRGGKPGTYLLYKNIRN